ncbi:hypothetical protein E2C01_037081 [Portunus trituberculatus]|uniref:Uncharacterized protein n=1 Tax=Portunus trituberculatus TaxID=210409 RepID=A0A5B7FEC9_PORTR|nr:hypothetical protein [Portunus trituberculatus]
MKRRSVSGSLRRLGGAKSRSAGRVSVPPGSGGQKATQRQHKGSTREMNITFSLLIYAGVNG